MPAAAGDGLPGEPAAGGGGAGGDAAREGGCLPAWVSGVPRERLRDFQHHKRVGHYLVGSRKLGEGSFAKVREGLHVLTGEKVSRRGRGGGPGGRRGRRPGPVPPGALASVGGWGSPGSRPPPLGSGTAPPGGHPRGWGARLRASGLEVGERPEPGRECARAHGGGGEQPALGGAQSPRRPRGPGGRGPPLHLRAGGWKFSRRGAPRPAPTACVEGSLRQVPKCRRPGCRAGRRPQASASAGGEGRGRAPSHPRPPPPPGAPPGASAVRS